jgi:hypothetical protein
VSNIYPKQKKHSFRQGSLSIIEIRRLRPIPENIWNKLETSLYILENPELSKNILHTLLDDTHISFRVDNNEMIVMTNDKVLYESHDISDIYTALTAWITHLFVKGYHNYFHIYHTTIPQILSK